MAAKESGLREIPIRDIELEPIVHEKSKVHKATWTKPETKEKVTVAVKMIQALSEESLKLNYGVHHKNLLVFHGAVLSPWKGIVTEFCSEGSLFAVLRDEDRKIEFSEKQEWALGIAEGMDHLHRSALPLERSIRLNNLTSVTVFMKKERGKLVPKIGGFGYAKVYSAHGSICGPKTLTTTDYAWHSPERIVGKPGVCGPKSDVYSFSIVLWELYTRKVPYKALNYTDLQLQNKVVEGKRPLKNEFTKENEVWETLISRCWAQDPEKRPSFKKIVRELEDAIEDAKCMQKPPEERSEEDKNSPVPNQNNSTDSGPPLEIHVLIQESDIAKDSDRECPKSGRFGRVSFATHKGNPIALRSLSARCTDDVKFRDYLKTVVTLAKCRSGNGESEYLVHVIGGYICTNPFGYKIAMERMETSLRDKLERCIITDDEVYKKIALDVARGLRYLHRSDPSQYHGGLTSANVLLSVKEYAESDKAESDKAAMTGVKIRTQHFVVDGSVIEDSSRYSVVAKISDFCCDMLAKEATESSPNIDIYKAPEGHRITEERDVYAYGVLLLEMGIAEHKIKEAVFSGKPDEKLRSLLSHDNIRPASFKDFAERCTKKSPRERPKMEEVVEKLNHIV